MAHAAGGGAGAARHADHVPIRQSREVVDEVAADHSLRAHDERRLALAHLPVSLAVFGIGDGLGDICDLDGYRAQDL
jgi:hypothetical protein